MLLAAGVYNISVTNTKDGSCIDDDDVNNNDYSETIQQICMIGTDQLYHILYL
jgi:hypothetical protein